MVWATVGSHVHWASLARLMPDPFVGFAVAGSAAINLVPQTAAALTDIREATAARGYAPPGVRSVASVLTPMINVGLDRSMRLGRGAGGAWVRRSAFRWHGRSQCSTIRLDHAARRGIRRRIWVNRGDRLGRDRRIWRRFGDASRRAGKCDGPNAIRRTRYRQETTRPRGLDRDLASIAVAFCVHRLPGSLIPAPSSMSRTRTSHAGAHALASPGAARPVVPALVAPAGSRADD